MNARKGEVQSSGLETLILPLLAAALWVAAAVWIARAGQRQGRSFALLLIAGLLLSPVVTGLVVWLLPRRTPG